MVLSDRDIRSELAAKRLRIEPLGDSAVQPASVDLRLGRQLLVFQNHLRAVHRRQAGHGAPDWRRWRSTRSTPSSSTPASSSWE